MLSPIHASVLVGRFNRENKDEFGWKEHSVWNIFLHPEWNINVENFDADIAVVVLRQEVEYSKYIKPVCLPAAADDVTTKDGYMVGWGRSENYLNSYPPTPSKLKFSAVNMKKCLKKTEGLADFYSNRTFCGGFDNEAKSACDGDSGSGFYTFQESKWSAGGIVSSGLLNEVGICNFNKYSLYTDVAKFVKWIEKILAESRKSIQKKAELKECTTFEGL